AVVGQRQPGRLLGFHLAGSGGELDAGGGVDEGLLRRALAAEEERARAVAGVGQREQLVADLLQLVGNALALDVAVARVARRHHQLARALQEIAGGAERALGLRHEDLAGVDGALARLAAADARERALGARCCGGVVARAVDALARRQLVLQRVELGLPARERVDAGVERVGGGDAHGGFPGKATTRRPAAACRTRTARLAGCAPPPGSSAGTGSAGPPPRRG